MWTGLVALGGLVVWRGGRARAIGLVPLVYVAMFLWKNPGYLLFRYAVPAAPVALVLATAAGTALLSRAGRSARGPLRAAVLAVLVLALGFLLVQPIRTFYRKTGHVVPLPADIVLDRESSEWIRDLLSPNDRVLVYEIQTQYYLPCRAVSADGIIGGEILPYLREGDVAGFIRDHGITHVLCSEAFLRRPIYRGTVLEWLGRANPTWEPGRSRVQGGVRFTKLRVVNRTGDWPIDHWTALFEIG